jgi:hypothetical protein
MKSIYFTLVTFAVMIFAFEGSAQTCAEGRIIQSPVFVYDANADSMIITVPVKNAGDKAFVAPFKITVYKDDIGNAKRYTYNYTNSIAAGETVNITFGIPSFKAGWTPFNNIKIRINDSGNGNSDQAMCNSDFRDYTRPQLIASDDYMLIFNGSDDNQFRVAINDILPSSYTSLTVNLLPVPAYTGTANVSGSTIFYTPATGTFADTLRYRIHCGNAEYADTATIYIKIIDKPDNIGDAECFVVPSATAWGIKTAWKSPQTDISEFIIPLVGDLDNDNVPEIVCFNKPRNQITAGSNATFVNKMSIYKGQTGNNPTLYNTITLPSGVTENDAAPYGLFRRPSDMLGLIVVASLDYKLRAYDMQSTGNTPIWTSNVNYGSVMGDFAVNVSFADFNGDGVPEVYVRDKIYNASTGILLATAPSGSNTGSSWAHWTHNDVGWKLSSPLAADVIGDSKPELILGNEIYTVNITNTGGTANNSITLAKSVTPPAEIVDDGHAQVADFNFDGHPDILITNRSGKSNTGSTPVGVYVWDVYNDALSVPLIINTVVSGKNIPLIADVNNNGKIDIILQCDKENDNYDVRAYEYNPATGAFEYLWGIDPDEDSYSNTATLFDFNQDGMNEVLITDQSTVRIFNGSGKSHITHGDTTEVYRMASLDFREITIMQYPIIADVDNDGNAEIVAVGDSNNGTTMTLNIFKSSGSTWAPARKVWNQYMYNSVNINENLTVPSTMMNPAIIFPGLDGQLGTSDDIQPYNNFLQQQTRLSKTGTSYWETADYAIEGIPTTFYYEIDDSLVISVCVSNYGDVPGIAPFHITIYQNSRQSSNVVVTKSFPNIPAPGQTVCYSIKVEDVKGNYNDLSSLHLWLNDDGGGTNVNPECDYTNGMVIYDVSSNISAENDYASVFACDAVAIPILANDEYTGTTFTILNTPKYGSVFQSGGGLAYVSNNSGTSGLNCEQTGNRTEIIRYKIESILASASNAEAYAEIKIYSPPEILLVNACSPNPKITLSNDYDGFTYDWEYSPDGASGWQFVATDSDSMELNIAATTAGFYRLTITYDGGKKYRLKKGVEVTTNRTTLLPGGIVWFELSFNPVNINWQI